MCPSNKNPKKNETTDQFTLTSGSCSHARTMVGDCQWTKTFIHYLFGSLLTGSKTTLTKQWHKQVFCFNGPRAITYLDSASMVSNQLCVSKVCQFWLGPFSLWAIINRFLLYLPCCYPVVPKKEVKTQGELIAGQTTIRIRKKWGEKMPQMILQTHLYQVENIRIGFSLWNGIFGNICLIYVQKCELRMVLKLCKQ